MTLIDELKQLMLEVGVEPAVVEQLDPSRQLSRQGVDSLDGPAFIMAVGAIGGDGGLIAMGPDGRPAFAINDLGMYRGRMSAGGTPQNAIFADEKLAD